MEGVREYDVDQLIALLPLPADDANKYTRGTLTAIAGSAKYPGAACLAAFASQRMGAGYTDVFTDPVAVPLVRAYRPSLVVHSWDDLTRDDLPTTQPTKPCACLIGSGFNAADGHAERLVHYALKHAKAPLLIDGGGLAALTSEKGKRLLKRRFTRGWPTVITPHGGEAARLAQAFDLPTHDPAELCRLLSLAYGVVSVLKGPQTFIADGEEIICMTQGTPALAKAGTGDVLAGMIGALLAQGLDALDACALGTTLHARAGTTAAARLSTISVTAEDIIEHIPTAIAELAGIEIISLTQ